jgi:low affinity Fe/Cu permease
MVFLIQNTQNRESAVVQLNSDELIRIQVGAHNAWIDLEELAEGELKHLRAALEALAQRARMDLQQGVVDPGTLEASPASIEPPMSCLVLFDAHGQVVWSRAVGHRRGGTRP